GAQENSLVAKTFTDLYVETAAGGSTPNADATINNVNQVYVDSGAQVLSVGDANLYAVPGTHFAKGEGHGEDSFAYIPFEFDGGSTTDTSSNGVTVNGTVKVGIQHIQNLTINENVGNDGQGTIGTNPDGTTFQRQVAGPTITTFGSVTGNGSTT